MKVKVVQNFSSKGRAVLACEDISEGEVLFEEEPLVSAQFLWNSLYKYRACDHCMRPLETTQEVCRRLTNQPSLVIPHPECCPVQTEQHVTCPHCQVPYCSSSCRDTALRLYHQTLCVSPDDEAHPLNVLAQAWRNVHYPPETCSIMLIARMVATLKQAGDSGAVLEAFSQFHRATVNEEQHIAHKLLGEQFQEPLETLRGLASAALEDEAVQQWFTVAGFRSIFALIGTNGQGIGTSSLSRWVKNCEALPDSDSLDPFIDQLYADIDKESGEFINCEGSGLYLLQSACNHSCQPNAEVQLPYDDFRLSMVALSDIKSGQEVVISYLSECDLSRSRYSRQKTLRENYLFECTCTKCIEQADQPDVSSEDEMDDDEDDE